MTQTTYYQLSEVANTAQAQSILKDFKALLKLGRSVEFDASLVKRIDSSILQLIVALQKSLHENQLSIIWLQCSQPFLDAVEALGLQKYFNFN